MPALQPLSMQIGALPPGFSTLSPQPAGPALAYGFNYGLPSLVQQVVLASTVAAPATFTLSGIASTAVGTYLVCLVALAESAAATITTPTNWTLLSGPSVGNAGNTIAGRIFVFPNNPGGITSVVFTTLTGVNGIACSFFEFKNVVAIDGNYAAGGNAGQGTYVNSSTTPSVSSYNPAIAGGVLLIGFETDLTGQAYTPANVGGAWTTDTTATSTTGATNCIIRPFHQFTTPLLNQAYQLAGTLAGALANGISLLSLVYTTSGTLTQPQPQGLPGGGAGQAWGALGNTKPGGAGSGQ